MGSLLDAPVAVAVLCGAAYAIALRRTSRTGRPSPRPMRPGERRRTIWFGVGLLAVLVAVTGPVERAAEGAEGLFWVHMIQHLLLLAVAAPAFALSAPWRVAPFLVPSPGRRRANAWWRRPTRGRRAGRAAAFVAAPAGAWALFEANLVAWHVPVAFDLTLRSDVAHGLEHGLFLVLGILFWRQGLEAPGVHGRLPAPQRAMFVTAASVVGWGIAIALTIAPSPVYRAYAAGGAGGPSALADQRIAAGIMLVPGSVPFVLAALAGLARWLDDDERSHRAVGSSSTALAGPARVGGER